MNACAFGKAKGYLIAQQLIAAGASVNAARSDGRTALKAAIDGMNPDLLQLLIDHGAEVDGPKGTDQTARFARIVSQPEKTWNNDAIRVTLQYPATIFELYDSGGNSIRSVRCMNDGGRWTFDENGDPHPVEATFPYQDRKKRERFTSIELAKPIAAFGLPDVTSETFEQAESFYLFECDVHVKSTCSIAEADDPAFGYYERGLGWVKYMNTHASSVIADFERCLQINREYEPKVKSFLDQAYQVLAGQK